ncbi:ribbon-helix-helix domain-containing protein [Paenibacillus alvei]|uniref:Ribbon-helix-helix domain-containing protein n=1 Tax=Paenibacillus alvei TaxID=44250 RepID=A0ABT4H3G7_PAEAL|nr:ribbon-helix-helix protein, CopG family [Paenibacillus alvei]MCY9763518.1 ribbon-helix-helix domain-containing protein [Paenibacillus alvei]MCY9765295.1 ribbon-helix-helix domain-containing protein [Paenibacillus alvei]NEZ44403.1 ribbon-helix-helix protein, CopG family [Paenibacillus alvei]
MPENQQRVQVLFDSDLLKRIDAEAKKLGMNRSEFLRVAAETKLSNNAAEQGLDTVLRMMRKILSDELNPQFNRLAKMIAKDTKASATSMYMLLVMASQLNMDAKTMFSKSEEKAAGYLTSKE